MNESDLRMGEWNNRRQWNMKVGNSYLFQRRAVILRESNVERFAITNIRLMITATIC